MKGMADYKRLSRILFLVPALSRKDGCRIIDVCREFGLSREELIGDIELISSAGYGDFGERELIDIYIERDRLYFHSGGLFRRPVRFSYGEALALKLGLDLVSGEGLLPAQQALFDIREKIGKLAAPGESGKPDDCIVFDAAGGVSPRGGGIIQELAGAVEETRVIRMRYYTLSRDSVSEKELRPYCLVCHDGQWYLIAYSPHDREIRRYRADRIESIQIPGKTFKLPKDFRVENCVTPTMFVTHDKLTKITVRFGKTVARWVEELNPKGKAQRDGGYVLDIETNSMDWLFSILMKYGPHAEIIKPVKVRKVFAEEVERMWGRYGKGK